MGKHCASLAFLPMESREFSSTAMTSDSTAATNVSASSLFTKAKLSSTKWSKHFQNPQRLPRRTSTNSKPICSKAGYPWLRNPGSRCPLGNVAGHQLPILGLGKHLSAAADERTVSKAVSLQLKHHPSSGVAQIPIHTEETRHGSGGVGGPAPNLTKRLGGQRPLPFDGTPRPRALKTPPGFPPPRPCPVPLPRKPHLPPP